MDENKEEPRYKEVIHSITYAEEDSIEEDFIDEDSELSDLNKINLDSEEDIANYYMAKNNMIDSDQLEVEKKEKELKNDIREVVEDKEGLIDYLTNLHASIEVMEERIYELELKASQKEQKSAESLRRPMSPGMGSKGLGSLPFGIF